MTEKTALNLVELAKKHGTDKWGSHWYAKHYEHHLNKFRGQSPKILEIGVGGEEDPYAGGNSLRMWAEYFPDSLIWGIDIFDKSPHDTDRIKTRVGSQDDIEFLRRLHEEGGPFDIIVDDGSHLSRHIIDTFNFMFPLLQDGGVYVIEDTQTSYWDIYGGTSEELNNKETTMGFSKSLVDGLNHVEFDIRGYQPTYTDQNIVGIHFYHNIVFIEKGLNDEESNIVVNNILPR